MKTLAWEADDWEDIDRDEAKSATRTIRGLASEVVLTTDDGVPATSALLMVPPVLPVSN